MPARLKFTMAYDGAPFAGWQSQAGGNTIQDHIERAFEEVVGTNIRVHGAGRTDAGVHALAQVAHVDLPNRSMAAEKWTSSLNALLPSAIRVTRCAYASAPFHARFSAKGKVYRYRIWTAPTLSPFELGRVWHVREPLNFSTLVKAAESCVGKHDFGAFAANRGRPERSTVRTIRAARVKRKGPLVTIEFDGDGFLYKMVRLITGSLVRCASGKITLSAVREALVYPGEKRVRFAAPACGLFLVRVRY